MTPGRELAAVALQEVLQPANVEQHEANDIAES